jgi:signal transduction histidine kinase
MNRKMLLKKNYQQVIFVILAFLAMVLVSYFYVSNIVSSQMRLICEGILNTTEAMVSERLLDRELSFRNISDSFESIISSGRSNAEVLRYMEEVNALYASQGSMIPDFQRIYGYIRGEVLDGLGWIPPDDYDARTRPWYIGARGSERGVYFSEPYVDVVTGEQVISFSQEIIDDSGNSYGVLAIDLTLSEISNYIQDQQIANNGYGVFITDQLHFAVHANPDLIGASMNDAGGDYRHFTYLLLNRQPITAERFTDYNGVDSIAFFRTIFNGWHIGVITPRSDYYRSVSNLAFVLGIIGFLLMVSLSYLLVKTTIKQMKADEESQSKSSFLARMSHEMRTPMNAIIGMTNIAKKTTDPERIRDCLEKISGASVHLLGVINDVLDMSKIEAGKLELSNADFDLNEMIAKVVDVVSFKFEEKHQHFTCDIAEDVPSFINSDMQLLSQVITNLLTNANKFTPDGGSIEMAVNLLELNDDGYMLQFGVKDNGIGIALEQQTRLFEPFEQADGSVSRKYGGTGLGLVISKWIVEMMHGRIWLESEAGCGSLFAFTIKAGIAAEHLTVQSDKADEENAAESIDFSGKKILLTEDVEINREIILTLLEDTHVEIDCAENGVEACEKIAHNPNKYDLIFMDIHMPEMDGYEAAQKIRAMDFEKAASIPIIAMTADVFREDVEKMLAAGMNDHIGKPVEIREIILKMKKYLF